MLYVLLQNGFSGNRITENLIFTVWGLSFPFKNIINMFMLIVILMFVRFALLMYSNIN